MDFRVRKRSANSKKTEEDLDSIHTIVFPEAHEIIFDKLLDQMMMDG